MAHRTTNRWRQRALAITATTGCAAGVLASPALVAPANAARATSYTQTVHGEDALDPDFGGNPCTGDPLTGTQRENIVQHVTLKDDEVWATFTEEAWVSLTDSPSSGPDITYSGHYAAWGNYNLNEKNQTSTFTFSMKLTGSDGSTIIGHEVTQFVLRPDGTVAVEFDKSSLTCS